MISKERLQQVEWLRWLFLRTAYQGGSLGVPDDSLQYVCADYQALTISDIRKEIYYLKGKNLLSVTEHRVKNWRLWITPEGTDYVQGQGPEIEGIYRPKTGEIIE